MHRLMTTRRPASAPGEPARMFLPPDEDPSANGLLLEMAFETQGGVALDQHAGVDRPVDRVAGGAALANRLMLEDKGTPLRDMTTATRVMLRGELSSASLDRPSFVRIVAIAAIDLPLRDRMVVGEIELRAFIQMAAITRFRRFAGVDDGMEGASGLIVNTARSMAGLAADVHGVLTLGLQPIVIRRHEVPRDVLVTLLAGFRPHKLRAGNGGGRQHGPAGGAGNQHDHQTQSGQDGQEPLERNPFPRCTSVAFRRSIGLNFHRF